MAHIISKQPKSSMPFFFKGQDGPKPLQRMTKRSDEKCTIYSIITGKYLFSLCMTKANSQYLQTQRSLCQSLHQMSMVLTSSALVYMCRRTLAQHLIQLRLLQTEVEVCTARDEQQLY
jgi:hypothetical protein